MEYPSTENLIPPDGINWTAAETVEQSTSDEGRWTAAETVDVDREELADKELEFRSSDDRSDERREKMNSINESHDPISCHVNDLTQ